jgi:hypothetical protein
MDIEVNYAMLIFPSMARMGVEVQLHEVELPLDKISVAFLDPHPQPVHLRRGDGVAHGVGLNDNLTLQETGPGILQEFASVDRFHFHPSLALLAKRASRRKWALMVRLEERFLRCQ